MSTHTDPVKTGKIKVKSTAAAARSRAEAAREDAEAVVRDAARALRTQAEERGAAARDGVADGVESLADKLDDAADQMTKGSPQANAAERVSKTAAGTAQSLRDSDLYTLGDSLAEVARRHPVAFAGAAALAGFAAGRFLKSSGTRASRSDRTPEVDTDLS